MPSQFSLTDEKKRLRSILQGISKEKRVTLAFSESETYDSFADVCEETSRRFPNFSIAALSYFVSKHLEEKSIKHDCVHTRVLGKEHSGLYHKAEFYSKQWFKDKTTGKDFTAIDGISLGSCVELLMVNFFQAVLKCFADLEVFVQSKKPDTVVFFDSGPQAIERMESWIDFNIFRGLVPFVCKKNEIDCVVVEADSQTRVKTGCGFIDHFKLSPPFKCAGFDIRFPMFLYAAVKNLFLIAKNLLVRGYLSPERPNILFANATTMSYLGFDLTRKILHSKKINAYVWNGESKEAGIVNVLDWLVWDGVIQRCNSAARRAESMRRFAENKEKIRLSTEYNGLSIFERYSFFFERLYRDYFPNLVMRAELLRRQIKKKAFRAVVSHADQSIYEKLTLLVGNSLSVPTVTFLHGIYAALPDSLVGFPSVSRFHLVWGKKDREIRMIKGDDAGKLKVVGSHLLEFLNYDKPGDAPQLEAPGNIIYITNSGGQCWCNHRISLLDNELHLQLLLETMRAFPQKTLIVKPRFDDIQTGLYRKLIRKSGLTNIVISDRNTVSLLQECDLFFAIFSTAALEAAILDKPGIQLLTSLKDKKFLPEKTGVVPLAEYGAALAIESPDAQSIISAVNSIYQSEETREKLRRGRIEFLRDYANLGGGNPAENFIKALLECLCADAEA